MLRALTVVVLLSASLLGPVPALAAWSQDPYTGSVGVCTATGYQNTLVALPDDAGGMFLVWTDTRSGNNDLYAQRVSGSGVPQWTANGVGVVVLAGTQTEPRIASDGAGGIIVAWTDGRAGNNDIYAQRLNASGTALWTANGIALCNATGAQRTRSLVWDGAGGAIAVWEDDRDGTTTDVYAQKVNGSGSVQWTANGVLVSNATGNQVAPVAVTDKAGGVLVAWMDFRSGTNYDIYVQRIASPGGVSWAASGVAICTATTSEADPRIVSDGSGGAIIAWEDNRNGVDTDLYARRVLASGTVIWGTNGVAVCTATADQEAPRMVSDGSGGAILAWQDNRSGNLDLYAQRMAPTGAMLWTANGVAVCNSAEDQDLKALLEDGLGGAFVGWGDARSLVDNDAYAQRIGPSGSAYWTSNGVMLCGAYQLQTGIVFATDGNAGVLAAWEDYRGATSSDIYAQRIERFGRLGLPEPAITKVKDVGGDQGGFVKVSWNASYLDEEPSYGIYDYRLWRSVPAASLTAERMLARGFSADPDEAAASGRWLALPAAAGGYAWELVGTMFAGLLPDYSMVAETTRDSLGGSNPYTAFIVEARSGTSISADRWYSAPDSGYSVDNLAPAAPAPFTGTYSGGASVLHWNPNAEADLAGYRLYRGSSASFTPSEANLVAALADTGHVDAAGAPYWYKLTAVDEHGNESPVATLLPSGTTAVEAGASARAFFALGSANPVRTGGTTTLRFSLAAAGRASLALYDASGRRVRELAGGTLEAGEHALTWDGRDEAGRAAAPGLYFARFESAGFTATRKLVVQD